MSQTDKRMIDAISPKGVRYSVPEGEMEAAKKRGWKIDYGDDSILGGLGALATGAARTAIPFSPTSFIAPEKQQQLKEQYPVLSGIGETLGMFAPVPLGGITGKIASPMLKAAVTGALSGVGSGAGQEISRAMLEDDELRAENILASGAAGGVLGGALGAGLQGIGKIGKSILSKIAQRKTNSVLQAVGFTPTYFEKNEYLKKPIAETVLKDDLVQWSAKDALSKVRQQYNKTGKAIGEFREQAVRNSRGERFDVSGMFDEIEKKVKAPLRDSLIPAKRQMLEELDENLSILANRAKESKKIGLRTMLNFRTHLDDAINDLASQGDVTKARRAPLREARDIIEKRIEKHIDETPNVNLKDYKKLKQHYAAIQTIKKTLAKKTAQEEAAPLFSALPKNPTLALGAAGLGYSFTGLPGAAMGYAAEIAGEKLRPKMPYIGAKLAIGAEKILKDDTGFLRSLSGAIPRVGKIAASIANPALSMDEEQTKDIIDRVDTLSKNPDAMQDAVQHIDDPIAGAKYAAGVHHLASQLPKSMREIDANSINPLRDATSENKKISKMEINRFKNAYVGFADPIGTIERAKNGQASPEAIDSVRVAYPKLYNVMVSRILENIANKDVSYRSKINLAALTGATLDDSLSAQGLANIQSSYGLGYSEKSQKKAQKTIVDLSNSSMSQSQRVQEKKR